MSSSVLTWGADPGSTPLLASERLRALERSHHAMWNYLTYRDAIGIVGLDPAELYPGGTTRLDPADWADLGWLTCFAGPPASAGGTDAATLAVVSADNGMALERLGALMTRPHSAAGDAHELYRRRELVETGLYVG